MLVYDPAKDGVDAGVLCGEEPVGVVGDRRPGRDPRARRRLRAVHAARASTSTTSSRCSSRGRTSSRRAASSSAAAQRLGDERRARVARRVRARRRVDLRDRAAAPASSPTRCRSRCCRCSAASTSIEIDEFAEPVAARLAAPAVRADGVRAAARRRSTRAASSYLARRVRARRSRVLAEAAGRPGRRLDRARARSRRRARRPTLAAGELAAGIGRRAADHDRRDAAAAPRSCGSRANWYCTTDVEPAWDLRPTGWRVQRARRRAARRRARVPGAARRARVVHARVHREPAGERDPVRVRGAARASSRRPTCRRSRRPGPDAIRCAEPCRDDRCRCSGCCRPWTSRARSSGRRAPTASSASSAAPACSYLIHPPAPFCPQCQSRDAAPDRGERPRHRRTRSP